MSYTNKNTLCIEEMRSTKTPNERGFKVANPLGPKRGGWRMGVHG